MDNNWQDLGVSRSKARIIDKILQKSWTAEGLNELRQKYGGPNTIGRAIRAELEKRGKNAR